MLDRLLIENYRCFDRLEVAPLARVNLLTGENNSGKTAFLEALRIHAAEGDATVINHILKNRGEFTPSWNESFDALFPRHAPMKTTLRIGKLQIERDEHDFSGNEYSVLTARLIKFQLDATASPDHPRDRAVFLPFGSQPFPLDAFWEKIALTDDEDDAKNILRLVQPDLLDIDVKGETAKIRLKNVQKPVGLGSLGDGVARMVRLAAALVNARNGRLLLDEIEAGLHHSVQTMLWEKIFHYSQLWNIQVFATTHSLDAVRAFGEVAERPENVGAGRLFRLEKTSKKGIQAVAYEADELAAVLEFDLETR